MKAIVDTDVLIWVLRGEPEIIATFHFYATKYAFFITPVQVAEIYAGMLPKEKPATVEFISAFPVINTDGVIAKVAGEFLNKYQKSNGLTLADALIAAACVEADAVLMTLNRKHYPMLSEDKMVDMAI